MTRIRRLGLTALAGALLAVTAPSGAVATEQFGEHVAMCAHQLGQRADVPTVVCTHDGMTMEFPTFGAMVEHMRLMH